MEIYLRALEKVERDQRQGIIGKKTEGALPMIGRFALQGGRYVYVPQLASQDLIIIFQTGPPSSMTTLNGNTKGPPETVLNLSEDRDTDSLGDGGNSKTHFEGCLGDQSSEDLENLFSEIRQSPIEEVLNKVEIISEVSPSLPTRGTSPRISDCEGECGSDPPLKCPILVSAGTTITSSLRER